MTLSAVPPHQSLFEKQCADSCSLITLDLDNQTQSIVNSAPKRPPLIFFGYVNVSSDPAFDPIAQQYGVQQTPTTIVIRGDGAIVTFAPKGEIDITTLKSTVGDAEKWYESHSTPTLVK